MRMSSTVISGAKKEAARTPKDPNSGLGSGATNSLRSPANFPCPEMKCMPARERFYQPATRTPARSPNQYLYGLQVPVSSAATGRYIQRTVSNWRHSAPLLAERSTLPRFTSSHPVRHHEYGRLARTGKIPQNGGVIFCDDRRSNRIGSPKSRHGEELE